MDAVPKALIVKKFREATGMGWMASKMFIAGRTDGLCERIVRAHEEQGDGTLHDPIEQEPEFEREISNARDTAEANHKEWIANRNEKLGSSGREKETGNWPRGSCHRIWKLMKEDLNSRGVTWYSPADMNPGHHFD